MAYKMDNNLHQYSLYLTNKLFMYCITLNTYYVAIFVIVNIIFDTKT